MSESIKPTPAPWAFHEQGEANEWALVTADGRWLISFRQNGELLTGKQGANAAHIVKCVNAHDGLVAALDAVLPALIRLGDFVGNDFVANDGTGRTVDRCAIVGQVRDALAKVQS
jgi:hypothetical protein